MPTPSGQPKAGVTDQNVPNRFPRREGGDGTEAGQDSSGYPDVSAANPGARGGSLIEGQNLRGYVPASGAQFPTEDGNRRPDGSERTIREVPAP